MKNYSSLSEMVRQVKETGRNPLDELPPERGMKICGECGSGNIHIDNPDALEAIMRGAVYREAKASVALDGETQSPQTKFVIPVKTVSEANQSEHWATKRKRKKNQQRVAALFCRRACIATLNPTHITLTRLAPWRIAKDGGRVLSGKLDDDNKAGSFKHVQDSIAKELGIDDGQIEWTYNQRNEKYHGVEVEIEIQPHSLSGGKVE